MDKDALSSSDSRKYPSLELPRWLRLEDFENPSPELLKAFKDLLAACEVRVKAND